MANKIPEKVWIQWYGDGDPTDPLDPMTDEDVTWCVDKITTTARTQR